MGVSDQLSPLDEQLGPHTCDAAIRSMPVLFCIVLHALEANNCQASRSFVKTDGFSGMEGSGAGMNVTR